MSVVERVLSWLSEFGMEYFGRFYGLYRATVTDNKDDRNQGRIKVKCPAVNGDVELLEWAYPVFMAAGEHGEFWPPEEGDSVLVCFDHGDPQYPSYVGGWYAKDELDEDFHVEGSGDDTKSPTVRGWKTKGGHKILLDDKDGEEQITIKWNAGSDNSTVVINKDGLNVKLSKGAGLKIEGKDANAVAVVGDGAVKAAVADHLETFWAQVKAKLDAHDAHVHPTSIGPSGPPNPPITAPSYDSKITSSKLKFPDG